MKKRKIILWSLFGVFLISIGTAAGYLVYLTDKAKNAAEGSHMALNRGAVSDMRKDSGDANASIDPSSDNISILFLGIDSSEDRDFNPDHARSDAMVLATFNEKNKSVKLVSIPRDSYVYVPIKDRMDKITHAHAYGGVDSAVATIENMFSVPVDYFVRLDFNAFIEVVDALDGIQYDVPFHLSEMDSHDRKNAIVLEPGVQTLNGEEALAIARTRKYDSDMERGKRQMEVMKAILGEAASIKSIGKYGRVIDSIGNNMKTNMSFDEMVSFHDYVLNRNLDVDTMQLEGENAFINDIYYYRLKDQSVSTIKDQLRTHLELDQSDNELTRDVSTFAQEENDNQEEVIAY